MGIRCIVKNDVELKGLLCYSRDSQEAADITTDWMKSEEFAAS
jgi:hypothetical protein